MKGKHKGDGPPESDADGKAGDMARKTIEGFQATIVRVADMHGVPADVVAWAALGAAVSIVTAVVGPVAARMQLQQLVDKIEQPV